jgi:preprotein translocase subunit SecG
VIAYVVYTVFVIACLILILVVLLQPGKGDVASALGGGVSGAAFGPRGATTVLAKITIGAAIAFMTIAFLFSIPGVVTQRSVTSGVEVPAEEEAPVEEPAPVEGTQVPEGQAPTDEQGTNPAQPAAPAEGNENAAPAQSDGGEQK